MYETFEIAGARGSGKSTAAQNLALQFIQAGQRVLYVIPYIQALRFLSKALAAHDGTPSLKIATLGTPLVGQRFDVIIADTDGPMPKREHDWLYGTAVMRFPATGGQLFTTVTV